LNNLSSYTKIADLGVILFENESKNNFYASPNKLFEYIHANIPILAPDYPFIRQVVTKYKIGTLIKEITSKNVADSILNMFENQDKYNSMKYNTQLAKKELNWEIEMKKLVDVYEKI
jgi:glycosyltransferase involved in cell wall biosynthesis